MIIVNGKEIQCVVVNGNVCPMYLNGQMITPTGEQPSPSVNYVLLQNMVPGGSIGVPVDYSDIYENSWHDHWIDTVLYEDWHHDDYVAYDNYADIWKTSHNANLVSYDIGSKMIDTRNPIDFSKYQITNGTPYGIFNGDDYTPTSLNFDLSETAFNPLNTTVECWVVARPDEYDTYSLSPWQSVFAVGSSMCLVDGQWNNGFQITVCAEDNNERSGVTVALTYSGINGSSMSLFGVYDDENDDFIGSGTYFKNWLLSWHHFALSIDSNYIYLLLDGKLVAQKAISDEITFEYQVWEAGAQTTETYEGTIAGILVQIPKWVQVGGVDQNQSCFDGGYAQLAVSDACKWTTDFQVPTTAY